MRVYLCRMLALGTVDACAILLTLTVLGAIYQFAFHEIHDASHTKSISLNPKDSVALGKRLYHPSMDLQEMENLVNKYTKNITKNLIEDSSAEKIIILVPYRQRKLNLLTFLLHMTPYLKIRRIPYEIVVIEQDGEKQFNRAKLFNAALSAIFQVNTSDRLSKSTCFAFHDVDKIPISMNTPYHCLFRPHQLLRYVHYKKGGKV